MYAQSSLTGTVTDNNGQPLKDISVLVKGKTTGTTTDDNGSFTITGSNNDILIFSNVNFVSLEIAEVNISRAKKLFLVVKDGEDNIDWDHADWIEPMLYNEKDSISLTFLKCNKASTGWGTVPVNGSVSGGKLIVNGKIYEKGIGTHSNCVIEFDLPEGYTKFKATVGIDEAGASQNTGATVKFMIFVQEPSGSVPPREEGVSINLKELGFNAAVTINDLWSGKELRTFTGEFAPVIKQHGAGLFRIKPKTSARTGLKGL